MTGASEGAWHQTRAGVHLVPRVVPKPSQQSSCEPLRNRSWYDSETNLVVRPGLFLTVNVRTITAVSVVIAVDLHHNRLLAKRFNRNYFREPCSEGSPEV